MSRAVSHPASIRRALGLAILIAAWVGVGYCGDSREQADPPLPPLLGLLRESRAAYENFAVRFVQDKSLALLDVTLKSEGMIFFRRPGAVRYEILSPIQSLLLYDGKRVRSYAFSEGQWKELNSPGAAAIGQVLCQIGHWIQGDFDADRKAFDVTVVPIEQGAGRIDLTPRSKAMARYVQRIEIHCEKAPDYRVTRVTIRESDVDVTDLRFSRELCNARIPDGTFLSPDASTACQSLFLEDDTGDPNEVEKSRS